MRPASRRWRLSRDALHARSGFGLQRATTVPKAGVPRRVHTAAGPVPGHGQENEATMIPSEPLSTMLLAGVVGGMVGAGLTAWLGRRRPPTSLDLGTTRAPPAAVPGPGSAEAGTEVSPADDTVTQARRVAERASRGAAVHLAMPVAADVLVVDDSAVVRAKLRRLLESAGYRVRVAVDGVDALDLLQQGRYRLMLTDLEMPRMDGVELIKACLAEPRTALMPILAISGHENLRARFDACQDISGVYPKPWADAILLSHVATLVGRCRVAAPAVPAASGV